MNNRPYNEQICGCNRRGEFECEVGVGGAAVEEVRKIVKSMGADDLIHLTIKEDGSGWAIYLDDKKLHHVESYRIESSTFPNATELSIKILVKYP